MTETVLVTGGAGYIGSHVCVELIDAGHELVIVDNFVNSSPDSLAAIEAAAGKRPHFIEADVIDSERMVRLLGEHNITAVIHLAALKAVGESTEQPLRYYRNNISGLVSLLDAMEKTGVRKFVFSSSATVYGDPEQVPIPETAPLSATNPYGWTKLMAEQILADLANSADDWSILALRYFNPVGAHPSGKIAEAPKGKPNNLMPAVIAAAKGEAAEVLVFGGDYDTVDGTGVRDYIHVMDLASGHVSAIDALSSMKGFDAYNLGLGKGVSVLELIAAVEQASGRTINFEVVDRRPGDVATSVADPTRAEKELGWSAKYDVQQACRDTWASQSA
ncbi:MAG: UDP-glucose 4-epimerase GalE [Acidimicrobiales bacterium]